MPVVSSQITLLKKLYQYTTLGMVSPCCIAGITFFTARSDVLKTPQRTLLIPVHPFLIELKTPPASSSEREHNHSVDEGRKAGGSLYKIILH
jgi:hypothetical protein